MAVDGGMSQNDLMMQTQADLIDAKIERKGKKQGDLPDIRRLEMDKKEDTGPQNEFRWDRLIETSAFESPSSMTEDDTDEREALSKRGFKLSYSDLGVSMDVKTSTGEDFTSAGDYSSAPEETPQEGGAD